MRASALVLKGEEIPPIGSRFMARSLGEKGKKLQSRGRGWGS